MVFELLEMVWKFYVLERFSGEGAIVGSKE